MVPSVVSVLRTVITFVLPSLLGGRTWVALSLCLWRQVKAAFSPKVPENPAFGSDLPPPSPHSTRDLYNIGYMASVT